ncbi:ABC transporter permease [Roseixanthobacter pseudopolyaromaticivorans]|uniref:ABC transporter permease n=1 Tax=Xanthobacteraceae TaxID=335928 RepID=UPI00372B58D6
MSIIRTTFPRVSLLVLAWLVLAFLVVPLTVILPVSFTDQPFLSMPKHGLSLKNYISFFSDPVWLASTAQSFIIAICATCLAVAFGGLCAVACWRLGGRLATALRLLMLAPLIVPTIVQAVGMYRMWAWLGIYDTYLGVIIAHAIVGLPYVVVTVSAALATVDPKLEQAARSLGASTGQAVRLVIFPNIAAGLFSGALFAFAHSFDELIVVLFLTSRAIATLPKRIWEGLQDDIDPTIAAAAVLLLLFTLGAMAISQLVKARSARGRLATEKDNGAALTVAASAPMAKPERGRSA